MVLIAFAPLLVALVRLVTYFVAANPKTSEAGRILFFTGMLAFLFAMGNETVRVRLG